MKFDTDRRGALIGLGTGLVLSGLTQGGAANAAAGAAPRLQDPADDRR
jgi:hypothetical protein